MLYQARCTMLNPPSCSTVFFVSCLQDIVVTPNIYCTKESTFSQKFQNLRSALIQQCRESLFGSCWNSQNFFAKWNEPYVVSLLGKPKLSFEFHCNAPIPFHLFWLFLVKMFQKFFWVLTFYVVQVSTTSDPSTIHFSCLTCSSSLFHSLQSRLNLKDYFFNITWYPGILLTIKRKLHF